MVPTRLSFQRIRNLGRSACGSPHVQYPVIRRRGLTVVRLIAEEVFGSNKALWFSPSGSKLAFGYFDDSHTPIITIPFYGYPGSLMFFQYTSAITIHYPKVSERVPGKPGERGETGNPAAATFPFRLIFRGPPPSREHSLCEPARHRSSLQTRRFCALVHRLHRVPDNSRVAGTCVSKRAGTRNRVWDFGQLPRMPREKRSFVDARRGENIEGTRIGGVVRAFSSVSRGTSLSGFYRRLFGSQVQLTTRLDCVAMSPSRVIERGPR